MKHRNRIISPRKSKRGNSRLQKTYRVKKSSKAPTTAEELFAQPRRFQDLWNRVVQVPSAMRAQELSLPQAARQFHVSPKTVLRLAGSAFTKKRGRYQVKSTDRLLRVLVIPGKKGLREIVVRDSREASVIGQYWSALEKFLSPTEDTTALRKLSRKTVKDANGKRVRLLTDINELKRQASAGVLHFESIYGRRV